MKQIKELISDAIDYIKDIDEDYYAGMHAAYQVVLETLEEVEVDKREISFLKWIKDNKWHTNSDGKWYTTNEKPYIYGRQRDFYTEEEVLEIYNNEYPIVDGVISLSNDIVLKREIYIWLNSTFTDNAPASYIISEYKKKFLYGKE